MKSYFELLINSVFLFVLQKISMLKFTSSSINFRIGDLEAELNNVRQEAKSNRIELDRLTSEMDEKNAKISQLHNKLFFIYLIKLMTYVKLISRSSTIFTSI